MNTKNILKIKNESNDSKLVLHQDKIIWKFKNIMDLKFIIGKEYKRVNKESGSTIRFVDLNNNGEIDKYIYYEDGYSYIGLDGEAISIYLKEVNNFLFSLKSNNLDFTPELLISSDNRTVDLVISSDKSNPVFRLDTPVSTQGKYFIFRFNLEASDLKELSRTIRVSLR